MKPLPAISPHAPLACCLESISCSWPLPVEWLFQAGSSCLLSWSGPAFCLPQTCACHLPFPCACCLPQTCACHLPFPCACCLPQTCTGHNDQGLVFWFCISGCCTTLPLHLCLSQWSDSGQTGRLWLHVKWLHTLQLLEICPTPVPVVATRLLPCVLCIIFL